MEAEKTNTEKNPEGSQEARDLINAILLKIEGGKLNDEMRPRKREMVDKVILKMEEEKSRHGEYPELTPTKLREFLNEIYSKPIPRMRELMEEVSQPPTVATSANSAEEPQARRRRFWGRRMLRTGAFEEQDVESDVKASETQATQETN